MGPLAERFTAELDFLGGREAELSEFDYVVMNIKHIITCLYKFSIAIRNPAPKERLHKIALIDVSFYENWDINHVEEKFHQVDSQNNFRVAKYLIERLGKANTRRRQLLKYYEAHHKTISRYIDDPLPPASAIEKNELTNAPKIVAPTLKSGSAGAPENSSGIERAATVYTTTKSQTTVSTIKVEISQVVEIEQAEEDRLSQTSYATSINHAMRIHVPSPPDEDAAYEGKEFQCPYCFKIIKVRSRQDWKYVGSLHRLIFYGMLNTFSGNIYSGIFSPMSAHSPTAPRQMNYMVASESGLIMWCSFTGESGIVMPARSLFHKRHYFKSIL